MTEEIKVIKKEQQTTTKWTGGTTTQLAIFPEDSSYTDRSFLWRLSSAVVELEESSFTKLPGYDRSLMVLEGQLQLVHEGAQPVALKQYETACFKGGWDTISYGKAKDFNLMVREGMKRKLEHCCIDKSQSSTITHENTGFIACYCHVGKVDIVYKMESTHLEAGELLLIRNTKNVMLEAFNKGEQTVHVIIALIEE